MKRREHRTNNCADKGFFKEETEALPPSGRFEIRDGGSRGRMNPEREGQMIRIRKLARFLDVSDRSGGQMRVK